MTTPLNVLVLEDQLSDAELMIHELKRSGFDPRWTRVETEAEFLAQLVQEWDVILSDYHMPQFDAERAMHLLKERKSAIPFIVVTGTVGEEVAVAMMREGVADYLLKDRLTRLGESVRHAVEQCRLKRRQREAELALVKEQLLAERRAAELETVLDIVPAVVFIAQDIQCRRITGSRQACELFRLPRGTNLSKSAPPGERLENFKVMQNGREIPPEQLPIQQAAQGHEVRGHEEDLVFTDGTVRTIFGNAVPLWDEHSRPRGAVGAFVDITERKRVEEALRESEEKFRAIFEQAAIGIGRVRFSDARWIDVNDALCRLVGYSREEMRATPWPQITYPEDVDLDLIPFRRMAAGELDTYSVEKRFIHKRGRHIWARLTLSLVRDAQGRPDYEIAIVEDITERKRNEEQLVASRLSAERAKITAQEANKAKDQFLAVLSHELRTPLTPVLAMVDLMQRESVLDEKIDQGLELIRRNVELEARLIDDLLDVNRIALGKVELNRRPVNVCQVLGAAVAVCKEDIVVRRLHFGVDEPDGPCWVDADATRLQQVFWNLLKNAIKFTPPGGCVGIRCYKKWKGNKEERENGVLSSSLSPVFIEFTDSGIGIEPDALERIFNAFEQGERTLTRQFGGLGLGLAISKSLVQLHGGTIEAFSQGKGRGATFRVCLPTIPAPAAAPAPHPAAETAPSSRRNLRILLVEDNGDTARLIKRLLVRDGHQVHIAADLATATDLVGRNQFDLLLSDLGLPDGSGYDLLKLLRSQNQTLPAIALSGYGQEQDILQSREAGFIEHLVKPVDINHLLSAIQRAAEAAPSASAAGAERGI